MLSRDNTAKLLKKKKNHFFYLSEQVTYNETARWKVHTHSYYSLRSEAIMNELKLGVWAPCPQTVSWSQQCSFTVSLRRKRTSLKHKGLKWQQYFKMYYQTPVGLHPPGHQKADSPSPKWKMIFFTPGKFCLAQEWKYIFHSWARQNAKYSTTSQLSTTAYQMMPRCLRRWKRELGDLTEVARVLQPPRGWKSRARVPRPCRYASWHHPRSSEKDHRVLLQKATSEAGRILFSMLKEEVPPSNEAKIKCSFCSVGRKNRNSTIFVVFP